MSSTELYFFFYIRDVNSDYHNAWIDYGPIRSNTVQNAVDKLKVLKNSVKSDDDWKLDMTMTEREYQKFINDYLD